MLKKGFEGRHEMAISIQRGRWALVAACLVAGFVGGLVGSLVRTPAHAADQIVYRAQRFELLRPDGEVIAVLGSDDAHYQHAFLTLGKGVSLEDEPLGGGRLSVYNNTNKSRIELYNIVNAGKNASFIEISGKDGDTVWRAP
jgi:hypothetical protein